MNRKKIEGNMSVIEVVTTMTEGNPGAIRVCSELLKSPDHSGLMLILDMDDMNIRGSDIWIAYKDFCKENIQYLKDCLCNRDKALVSFMNASPEVKARIVTGGAS